METGMSRSRLAPLLAIAAVMIGLGWPHQGLAQTKVPTQSIDPFGQEVKLAAKTIVYVGGSGTWDKAYDTLFEAFKKVGAYLDAAGLKSARPPMTISTSTDDTGYDFKAAVPLSAPPPAPPNRARPAARSRSANRPTEKCLPAPQLYDEMNQTTRRSPNAWTEGTGRRI